MLTLLEDRNINGYELGKGWMIILAGNPVCCKFFIKLEQIKILTKCV